VQGSPGDGVFTDYVNNPTFTDMISTENAGNGFRFIRTNDALLCNSTSHANGAADVFISATSDGTNIYGGCIKCENIIDNGTNSCIFLVDEAFKQIFNLLGFCCPAPFVSNCVCTT
jgi:hypothetical protein